MGSWRWLARVAPQPLARKKYRHTGGEAATKSPHKTRQMKPSDFPAQISELQAQMELLRPEVRHATLAKALYQKAPGFANASKKINGLGDMRSKRTLGNPTPRIPHQHPKWALVPIGFLFRGPRPAGRRPERGGGARQSRYAGAAAPTPLGRCARLGHCEFASYVCVTHKSDTLLDHLLVHFEIRIQISV